jgi:aryl-alcohol dehydrogenase-like predicted oxidoreductase
VQYGEIPGVGRVSRLILGTLVFDTSRLELVRELLEAYVGIGGNAVDTAYIYAGGGAERALGWWLRERAAKGHLCIIDKGCHPFGDGAPRVTPEALAHDLQASLERLGVDQIDLYLLHRDDPSLPVGPILQALEGHRRRGRIRAYGASNWTPARLEEAAAYARAHGLTGFCCSSPGLSLAEARVPRWPGCVSVDAAGRAWYARTQLPLLAWSSQAGGFFTERCAPDRQDDPGLVRTYYTPENWERRRRAEELGRRLGYDANQVALAWVLHQPFPTFAIIGPRSVEELRSSARALEIRLSPAEVRWLALEDGAPA